MTGLLRVLAQLVDKDTHKPLGEEGCLATLYDMDIVDDDILATCHPDIQGKVEFTFSLADMKSFDSPGEEKPDLYIVVFKKDDPMMKRIMTYRKSKLFPNIDFLKRDPVTEQQDDLTQDLGVLYM